MSEPKKVYLFTKDGEFVKEFPSMGQCATYFRAQPSEVFKALESGNPFKKWYVLSSTSEFPRKDRAAVVAVKAVKKKKSKPAKIPSGTLLEKKILAEIRDANRAMNTVSLYDRINPSIPLSVFSRLVKQMIADEKITSKGKWLWIGRNQGPEPVATPKARKSVNSNIRSGDGKFQRQLEAINAEIGKAASMVAGLMERRLVLLKSHGYDDTGKPDPDITSKIIALVGQRECTVTEILGELGLPSEYSRYPKQLYDAGRIARKGYPRQGDGTIIKYATPDWYERNRITNYVTPRRLAEFASKA